MMMMMMTSHCNAFSYTRIIAATTTTGRRRLRRLLYDASDVYHSKKTWSTCLAMAGVRTRGLEKRREGPTPTGTTTTNNRMQMLLE
jgi:hypothetical protein